MNAGDLGFIVNNIKFYFSLAASYNRCHERKQRQNEVFHWKCLNQFAYLKNILKCAACILEIIFLKWLLFALKNNPVL
jgi:hypothetical protein